MPGMRPEDVYRLRAASEPRVSPDGRTVAFTATWIDREANDYRSAVWIVPADGSRSPRRLTSGNRRDSAPRWSPDGRALAFASNRDSDHLQLYVLPLEGGEPVRLTSMRADVAEPCWSPEGDRISFSCRVPGPLYDETDERRREPHRFRRLQYKLDNVGWTGDRRSHLFVVDADGTSDPHQITDGDFEDSAPAWSPDGRRIAFSSARHDDWDVHPVTDLYVVDAGGGEPERLTHMDGRCEAPSWSPDSSRVAYLYTPGVWDDPRHGRVAILDVATRERRVLTEDLDRNCSPYPHMREPIWTDDGLLFAVEDRGNTHVYRVPADGSREAEAAVSGELRVSDYDAAAGTLVHAASTVTTPPEIFNGGRPLSAVGTGFAAQAQHPGASRFTATSADGAEVEAWIMTPPGLERGRRYPALLNIHGGPFTQYGNGFFDEFHVYAGAGYVVLYANPRGSSGYSEEWGRAIRGPSNGGPGWGTVDYDDVMAVVDEALRRFDVIDAERIGVMGGSYGGYLASWIVGRTDRFGAACSERAVNNWVSMYGSSDFGWTFKGEIGSFLFEDFDAYVRLSPSTYAEKITTPLLILHSESDLRCPVEQAEQLFTTLRLLGREVEFVRFPAESHELSRSGSPAHRVMRFEVVLEWFGRHLRPRE